VLPVLCMPRPDDILNMDDGNRDDLATLWSLPSGACCIIGPRGMGWHVRVEYDGAVVREHTVPNSRTAVALAEDWEREFKPQSTRESSRESRWACRERRRSTASHS